MTDNNVLVRDEPKSEPFLSVMTDHPLFMTNRTEMARNNGHISTGFG